MQKQPQNISTTAIPHSTALVEPSLHITSTISATAGAEVSHSTASFLATMQPLNRYVIAYGA